ncbi:phosphatidate cytidylyltransferase [Tistlia consotensis]|uniref:Phosphatidate cytidylyltransferase n=1 Tax=Tistlia consotensis USBA 355 TaxID=560819 RepID=A0A1Y6CL73_9PROT|nr:phosphatidate cytidylyltransferase [Tistlia consotensis]SMF70579.1 phosphatidate cytidylyltransferase [Tistlia consotensis USBA 355]SNS04588.1 phosphatidate cytidylyltransferase [Tistlia consotensis]
MVTRVVSSLVLAPIVLLAIHLGPPASDGLLLAAAAVMAWEWGRICGRRRGFGAAEGAVVAGTVAPVAAGALLGPSIASWVVAVGALAAALVAARDERRAPVGGQPGTGPGGGDLSLWFGFGVLYLAVPLLALQWLRGPAGAGQGELPVFWVVGLVWATDVGAFFVGRSIGGPKLWPRVSPNKTWAGMVGGLVSAGLVGAVFALAAEPGALWRLVLLSAVLSAVAQAGDFFESGVKRQFGAKDASDLIPGHGGLLDRVDGLLAATLALAFLAWLGKAPF